MDARALNAALDAIYQSATSPQHWPVALEGLAGLFGCSCVSLVDKNRRTLQGRAAQWGVDAASEREYLEVWLERNVLHHHTRVWRQGEVETDRDVLPKHEFMRSDYYNGFMKPRDMHAMLRVATHVDDEHLEILALARPQSAGEYEPSDVEELRPLVRHVQRAAAISRHLDASRESLRGAQDVLEQSSNGILLLSRTGRVVFANRAAQSIIAATDRLRLRADKLSAQRRSDDTALQRLIAGATGLVGEIHDARGGAIRIAEESQRTHIVVVGPLDGRRTIDDQSPAAFVLLTDPDRATSRSMLASLYGLSVAETAIAERLMRGDTPNQAAAALNIKISTARWHLSALFRKTDTKRQAELVRLLLSLPGI